MMRDQRMSFLMRDPGSACPRAAVAFPKNVELSRLLPV